MRSAGGRRGGGAEGGGGDLAIMLLSRCALFWMAPLTMLMLAFSGGAAAPEAAGPEQDRMELVALPAVLLFAVSVFGLAVDCMLKSSGLIWMLQAIVQSVLLVAF